MSDGVCRPASFLVSDQDEKYRRYAEEAQLQANKAISAQDKESWLKIARRWLEMLPKRTLTAEDQFNYKVRDLGSGQEESGSMN
jgi:allantoicase